MTFVRLMGILNVTPDSFYEKSRFLDHDSAIKRGIEIYKQGADLIDIGGASTRPGSDPVPVNEELDRVIPVIRALSKEIPIPISIDTMKPQVAEAAIEAGALMINDVDGFADPEMRRIAACFNIPICIMHKQGAPKTMQNNPIYLEGIISHLLKYFTEQTALLMKIGVPKENIIIDPGIGFGKTIADNLEIIHNLPRLKDIGYPILIGVSRKSFLSKLLNKPNTDLLAPTLAVNALSIIRGADIIRVHDIQEHRDVINVLEWL